MNKQWFTRAYQKEVDSNYLHNMFEATQFFMRWFSNSDIPFREMLQTLHKIVSVDYQGHTTGNYILKVSNEFRGEPDTTWYPILKKRWFTGIGDEKIIRPDVPHVPQHMSHWLANTEEGYVLHLPDSKWVDAYLGVMRILMWQMRGTEFFVKNTPLDLEALADYIHLFVIGHPFEKINFSICMAQVNAILYMKGYEPVYHGWLDFECFMYDHHRIVKIFIDKVRKREFPM